MTPKNILKVFIPPKNICFTETPPPPKKKNKYILKFKILNPKKKRLEPTYVWKYQSTRTPPPPLDTSDYTFSIRRKPFLQDIWLKSKTFYGFPCVVTSTGPGGFMICVCILWRGHPKAQQKWFYGEAGNRTCDPWFISRFIVYKFIPYTMAASFCWQWKPVLIVKELGFWKLTWHNCPARKGLTSEIVRTNLLQHF